MPNWTGGGPGDYLEVWDMGPAAAAANAGPNLTLLTSAPPDVKPTPSDLRMALNVEPIGESIFYRNKGINFKEGNNNDATPKVGDASRNNAPVATVTFPVVALPANGPAGLPPAVKVKAKREAPDKTKREILENQECNSMCHSLKMPINLVAKTSKRDGFDGFRMGLF